MTKLQLLAVALLASALTFPAFAADKEVTIKGEGQCGKCSLKETKTCQNVIKTAAGQTYYVAENDVSKKFYSETRTEKKFTATGTVKEVDGKQQLTVTKIEATK